MSDEKAFKALDEDYREGLRVRIQAAKLIDKLQNHVMNASAFPMSQTQLKAALGLLGYVLPQLKAVEHTNAPKRAETRDELIEAIARIYAGTAAVADAPRTEGTAATDGATEVRH